MNDDQLCEHLEDVAEILGPAERICEECARVGARWVHLRTCQDCGITLCCDSSPNRHARGHHQATGHPVIASAEPGENWLYCFVDDRTADPD